MRTDDKQSHTDNEPLHPDDEDLYGDADRWLTAADPDPEPPEPKSQAELKKLRDKYMREHEERFAPSAFGSRTANAAIRANRKKPRRHLYGDLWLQGELVVLTGPPASGKTILATQIAETIARGLVPPAASGSGSPPCLGRVSRPPRRGGSSRKQQTTDNRPLTTLFLDLEHTDAAFTERYTVEVPFHPRRTKTYRFSPHLKRPDVQTLDIPEAYRSRYLEWMIHSLHRIIEDTGAQIIVIDNITLLDNTGRADKLTRLLRYLRRLVRGTDLSILVTYPLPQPSKSASQAPFRIPPSQFRVLNSADRILALNHTTIAPDHRYLKVLKGGVSVSGPSVSAGAAQAPLLPEEGWHRFGDGVVGADDVYVFRLERNEAPGSPPYEGGVAAASADGVVLPETPSSLNSADSANSPDPSGEPFLGLTYLGTSPERLHLIDYEAFQTPLLPEEGWPSLGGRGGGRLYPRRPGRPSKKDEVVEMLLDPAYGRYLKGEK